MYGNSPITVQLDAQVPWLVTNYSEPSMLAPIGTPAATSETAFVHSFMHGNLSHCKSHDGRHNPWHSMHLKCAVIQQVHNMRSPSDVACTCRTEVT